MIVGKLAAEVITITASRICPHTDEDVCPCRKPKPGMILELCELHGIAPAESAMIGDSATDIEAGSAAGCADVFLVESGQEFADAVRQILSE